MTLDQMIHTGLSLIRNDPHHDLNVGFRCQLLSRIQPRHKRVKLMSLAVAKVSGLWESLLPSDRTPHEALAVVEKFLAGGVPATVAEREMGKLWTHCDDLAWRHADSQSVIMVGYGAAQVIREALSERHIGCDQVTEATTEQEMDPYDYDAAFCAATAYSFGPPGEVGSDPNRRLEFWTWWLTSAVDSACSSP